VRDMVRISDARMSGTSYGACVLHVTPESHVGGPLALVRDGDPITIDLDARRVDLEVDAKVLEQRRKEWQAPAKQFDRGWLQIYRRNVGPLSQGAVLTRDHRE
jgi:dihydroxyacid dehydratase/phosphogluconate dehydratase